MTGRAAVPLLAVAMLAGCGQSATDKATANLSQSFDRLALRQNYGAVLKDVQNRPGRLDADLHRYDVSARHAATDLGKPKVRAIVAQDATDIAGLCQRCADALDRTRATL